MPRSTSPALSLATCITAAALLGAPALAQDTITYEDLDEGFQGAVFAHMGVTYQDINQVSGVFPDGSTFGPQPFDEAVIEDATFFYNDFPTWGSPENALTFGNAFIPGDNLSIGRVSSVTMLLDAAASSATMDVAFLENGPWGGIVIRLDAIEAGEVVASDSITIADGGGRDNAALGVLSVSADAFDQLHLYATFGDEFSLPRVLVDDLVLSSGCAADFDGDGELTLFDFLAFQNAFDAGDGAADFDGDGSLTLFDFLAFQNAFDAGCA
ncbi:MAG: hypothetical protein HRU13_03545 [Phycisphaerales bacterium]|nr:hypothetical protein [Phycisphaerales bacterium]